MKAGIPCWRGAVGNLGARGVSLPRLQMLITSDEEGESIDGTVRLVEALTGDGELPDAAIVGEPSSLRQVGDTVRRGRRGVVLEVDGSHHFTSPDGRPDAARYAAGVRGDRDLKLSGYEVFRFGATELQDREQARNLLGQFTATLLPQIAKDQPMLGIGA